MLHNGAPHVPATQIAASCRTIFDLLRVRAERDPDVVAYFEKDADGAWRATSWRGFYELAAAAAGGLRQLGIARGDRIAILGPTRSKWSVCDFAGQLLGAVPLGIYPQQTVEQIRYLLEHSEARAVIIGDEREVDPVLAAAQGVAGIVAIVPWDEAIHARLKGRDPRVVAPSALAGPRLSNTAIRESLAAIDPEDTALLVYTSGTTGAPKGAMISHRNVTSMLGSGGAMIDSMADDLSLSFLPMAHVAERILSGYGRVSVGMSTAYASSVGAVLTEMREVAPTVFGSVPRIFEKAYSKIFGEIEKKPKAVQSLFHWAVRTGKERVHYLVEGRKPPAWLEVQHALADRLVFRKIRAAFGGRIRFFIVGAAPTPVEIQEFFWAAGLPTLEVYGMTEATTVTHANRPGQTKIGTVGKLIAQLEQKIAEDGELLLRGPWVFKGYYKNPEATAETVDAAGWLHTGDVASLGGDGYVRITDRKKHLIITAGGKNLAPGNIEAAIKASDPLISHVVPHGDRRAYVTALIAPSPLETLDWGLQRGLVSKEEVEARTAELVANPSGRTEALARAMAKVVANPEFSRRIAQAVHRGNQRLAHVESVRRFLLLSRDLCQEHGELTPTMKVRRKEVEKKYAAELDRLYTDDSYGVTVS